MNLLGGPWNMARAVVPYMSRGGSIVNVSTIFSRTHYYGRIPYMVPKSGLNALSIGLARELGDEYGIRVNTLFPGPIESERIDTVFSNMDALQQAPPGTTSREFRALMIARRETPDGEYEYRYPTPVDVAATVTYLASEESAGMSGRCRRLRARRDRLAGGLRGGAFWPRSCRATSAPKFSSTPWPRVP